VAQDRDGKMLGNSRVDEQLAASQEEPSSKNLVPILVVPVFRSVRYISVICALCFAWGRALLRSAYRLGATKSCNGLRIIGR
jgi:hypothetical protein